MTWAGYKKTGLMLTDYDMQPAQLRRQLEQHRHDIEQAGGVAVQDDGNDDDGAAADPDARKTRLLTIARRSQAGDVANNQRTGLRSVADCALRFRCPLTPSQECVKRTI